MTDPALVTCPTCDLSHHPNRDVLSPHQRALVHECPTCGAGRGEQCTESCSREDADAWLSKDGTPRRYMPQGTWHYQRTCPTCGGEGRCSPGAAAAAILAADPELEGFLHPRIHRITINTEVGTSVDPDRLVDAFTRAIDAAKEGP